MKKQVKALNQSNGIQSQLGSVSSKAKLNMIYLKPECLINTPETKAGTKQMVLTAL